MKGTEKVQVNAHTRAAMEAIERGESPKPLTCSRQHISPNAEPCGDWCENCVRNTAHELAYQLRNCRRSRDRLLDRALDGEVIDTVEAAERLQLFACRRWRGTFNGGWTPDGRGEVFWQELLVAALEAAGYVCEEEKAA